ncbi:MAG: hypothetical protein K2X86_09280 [Cytophagaceae bacterium]|nr:hypothetical protein [Cytophagaceae bacterium]
MKRLIIIVNALILLSLSSCGGSRNHARKDSRRYDTHTKSGRYNQEQHPEQEHHYNNQQRHNY